MVIVERVQYIEPHDNLLVIDPFFVFFVECKDALEYCPVFAARGYCEPDHQYGSYVRKNCQASCTICKGMSNISSIHEVVMCSRPLRIVVYNEKTKQNMNC